MKKYEKYKDSGIDWLGEIPAHWEVRKLKYLIRKLEIGKRESNPKSNDILSIGGEHINSNGKIEIKNPRYVSQEFYENLKKGRVEKNDILMVKDGATIGKTAFVDFDPKNKMLLNEHVYKIVSHKFYYFFFLSHYFQSSIWKENQSSAQEGITRSTILNIFSFFIPSFHEQTAIANYLDRKTAQIDQLIANKKRLLELYEEEKTAIINQAVTKGLPCKDGQPSVSFKHSGIDWLGEIPKHWEVKKLMYFVLKVGSGITPRGGANVYVSSGIPLLRSQNIHFEGLLVDDVAYIPETIHNEMSSSKVYSGDVLLNITGASIGRCFYITDGLGEANVNQHVCIIRPKSNLNTKFLYFVLRSHIGQEQINLEQTGSGREGLNFEAIKNFIMPKLNINEQQEIVDYIEKEITRINAKAEKTKKLIELLEEYKQALISEVVTGKVKVV